MEQFVQQFIKEHGTRIFWLLMTVILAVSFFFLEGMMESGKTLLIAVAALCLNKARSPKDKGETDGIVRGGNRPD